MSAGAEEVGLAIVVKPQVRAYPPQGEASYDLVERDPIERGLKVKLVNRESLLKIAFTREFGCKRVTLSAPRSLAISGVLKMLGPSEMSVGDVTRPCEPRLHFTLGKLWLALAPDEPPVDVETPDAVAGVKGTYVLILVNRIVGTLVVVYEGTVTLQAKAGGASLDVKVGQWVVVPPGELPTRPSPLPADDEFLEDPLLPCCTGIEPPKPPVP